MSLPSLDGESSVTPPGVPRHGILLILSLNGPISLDFPHGLPGLLSSPRKAAQAISFRHEWNTEFALEGRPRRASHAALFGEGKTKTRIGDFTLSRTFCTVSVWHLCVRPFDREQNGVCMYMCIPTRIYGTNYTGKINNGRRRFQAVRPEVPSPRMICARVLILRAWPHECFVRNGDYAKGSRDWRDVFFFIARGPARHHIATYQMYKMGSRLRIKSKLSVYFAIKLQKNCLTIGRKENVEFSCTLAVVRN